MKLTLTMQCDTAAFSCGNDGEDPEEDKAQGSEIARVLRHLADKLERVDIVEAGDSYPLTDYNGNNVGRATMD